MTRRPDLCEAMMESTRMESESPPAEIVKEESARYGNVLIGGHFDPAVRKQLKTINLDQDKTVQTLLAEALNDLFAKNGKPEIVIRKN